MKNPIYKIAVEYQKRIKFTKIAVDNDAVYTEVKPFVQKTVVEKLNEGLNKPGGEQILDCNLVYELKYYHEFGKAPQITWQIQQIQPDAGTAPEYTTWAKNILTNIFPTVSQALKNSVAKNKFAPTKDDTVAQVKFEVAWNVGK